ncbi:MAG: hypothetical protein KDC38_15670, partial [Planctomycetes bacterium]|nr:hypothetical protein [Planctomycetota bacterium]
MSLGRLLGLPLVTVLALMAGCRNGSTSDPQTSGSNSGPQTQSVRYVDLDANGVDSGDVLIVTFDDVVTLLSTSTNAFAFNSALDTLGTGATTEQTVPVSRRVTITLGSGASFTPDSSVFDIRSSGAAQIQDLQGAGSRAIPGGQRVTTFTGVSPTLVSARYEDVDNDGTVNAGDTIICEFDKPVLVPSGATVANNFALAVTGDSFGTSPTLAAYSSSVNNCGVVITLGASPTLTVTGTFDSAATTAGSPSNVQVAGAATVTLLDTRATGATNVTAGTSVDLSTQGNTRYRNGSNGSRFLGT